MTTLTLILWVVWLRIRQTTRRRPPTARHSLRTPGCRPHPHPLPHARHRRAENLYSVRAVLFLAGVTPTPALA